ncbi:hypothetical protein [Streptomyces tsukubensis]|uniref:Uncharacterized protein n=1 Tax=Streptomyces tsukubensis TaxID=83656 RepID=A0A1V4A7D4_9ACTN|nr:hypothetical protein [Streptomyces tsukubensis]OON77360.1 hypothetical protein B1H18_19190 [Streptomyces tsukubensis]QFR92443.1 hypothetical protein GBW32_04415 [Streptomyces tsukubensis]
MKPGLSRQKPELSRAETGARQEPGRGGTKSLSSAGTRTLVAASIARLRGLPEVRVGDRLGEGACPGDTFRFCPPSLETVVRPRAVGQEARPHAALTALADEDPLIRTRPAGGGATSVLLYGAVHKDPLARTRVSRRAEGGDPP